MPRTLPAIAVGLSIVPFLGVSGRAQARSAPAGSSTVSPEAARRIDASADNLAGTLKQALRSDVGKRKHDGRHKSSMGTRTGVTVRYWKVSLHEVGEAKLRLIDNVSRTGALAVELEKFRSHLNAVRPSEADASCEEKCARDSYLRTLGAIIKRREAEIEALLAERTALQRILSSTGDLHAAPVEDLDYKIVKETEVDYF